MIHKWIGKDLEGSDRGVREVLFRIVTGEINEDQKTLRKPLSHPRFHYKCRALDCVWNVTEHAQKSDFVFQRNGRVHLNRQGTSVQSTTGSRGVRISGSNAGYAVFRGSVKSTGYPLHSPVYPSLPLPCFAVCYHLSTGLYYTSTHCVC